MSITVDEHHLSADTLGFRTVGHVLNYLQRSNRLVVNVTLNGEAPDFDHMTEFRTLGLDDNELFIETVDPSDMANSVLDEVETQLLNTDHTRAEVADLLHADRTGKAMEKLSGCFSIWQHAQQSLAQTARLMGMDLGTLHVEDRPLNDFLQDFSAQLRTIRDALEARDFVMLGDVLTYEMGDSSRLWHAAIQAMRDIVAGRAPTLQSVA